MRGTSHLAIGFLTGLGVPLLAPDAPLSSTGVCLAAFSSLVPDIDEPHSILVKKLSPAFEKIIPPIPMMRRLLLAIGGFLLAYGGLSIQALHANLLILIWIVGALYVGLGLLCEGKKLHQHSLLLVGGTVFLLGYIYSRGDVMMSGLAIAMLGTIFQAEKMRMIFLSIAGGSLAFLGFMMSLWWLVALGLFFAIAPWLPHRGLTHTIWALALWGYICYGMEQYFHTSGLFWFGIAGYASHLLADSITKERVKWFWPLWNQPLGVRLIRVGSDQGNYLERMIIAGLFCVVFLQYAAQANWLLK